VGADHADEHAIGGIAGAAQEGCVEVYLDELCGGVELDGARDPQALGSSEELDLDAAGTAAHFEAQTIRFQERQVAYVQGAVVSRFDLQGRWLVGVGHHTDLGFATCSPTAGDQAADIPAGQHLGGWLGRLLAYDLEDGRTAKGTLATRLHWMAAGREGCEQK
jgi:hypothetical protein